MGGTAEPNAGLCPSDGTEAVFYFKGGEKMEPVRFFYKRWRSSENTKYKF